MQLPSLQSILPLFFLFVLLLLLYLYDDKKNSVSDPTLHKATIGVAGGMGIVFAGFIVMLCNLGLIPAGVMMLAGGYVWTKYDRLRRSCKASYDADAALVSKREKAEKKTKRQKKNTLPKRTP